MAKFTSSSVPAATLPVPETVVWTTPSAALTTSVSVRAELLGVPTCGTAEPPRRHETKKHQGDGPPPSLLLLNHPDNIRKRRQRTGRAVSESCRKAVRSVAR